MKSFIYIRTSTEEQNPENQLNDCHAVAKKLGLECEIISDRTSGWKDVAREGFDSIKRQIEKGQVANIICWDLDRLYRNRKRLVAFFELCKMRKCRIYSFRQQWFDSIYSMPAPFNEMMEGFFLQFLGWIAEEESTKKSERVRIAIRKNDGRTVSYKGNKWGRRELPEETRKAIIVAYQQNKTYSQICSEVFYWDASRNKKNVSRGIVHKTIAQFKRENGS